MQHMGESTVIYSNAVIPSALPFFRLVPLSMLTHSAQALSLLWQNDFPRSTALFTVTLSSLALLGISGTEGAKQSEVNRLTFFPNIMVN